jgi:hypothetical protein
MNLDFSFYNWDLISNFVLKGLYFSLMLTLVATIGGIAGHGAGADAPVGQANGWMCPPPSTSTACARFRW